MSIDKHNLPKKLRKIQEIQYNVDYTPTGHVEGRLTWNNTDKTLQMDTEINGTVLQLGQEQFVKVSNQTGSLIEDGSVVYINGAQGNRPTITKADATDEATSNATIGLATSDIPYLSNGYVTTFGLVRGVNTLGMAEGAVLWLSETTGEYTTTIPASPAHAVKIGNVIVASEDEGVILVNVDNGFEIFELHDVDGSLVAPVDGQIFFWNDTTKLWEQTDDLYWDYTNDRVGIGTNSPDTKLEVAGAITIDELSTDPTDPVEGNAVFWKGDGTGTGADGDLLYMEQSGGVVSTGNLKWTDFTPSSITVNASDGTTGSVSDVQEMFDGNIYQIEELAATPGFDVEFIFSGVDKYPSMVVTRWKYTGSATHDVTWDIWNYNDSAWDTLRVFRDSGGYESSMTMYIPRNSNGDYVSGGASKVRVYHQSGGAAAHDIQIDYVGLTHSLQGVI